MTSIKEFQDQLLTDPEKNASFKTNFGHPVSDIVVLKNYRFYKSLSIELYTAAITRAGKLKNPLAIVNPLDVTLTKHTPDELKFFTAVSRFQLNPTAAKTSLDIDALRQVIKNPLGLRFFYHNPERSENIVASSLLEVSIGDPINDVILTVYQKPQSYLVIAEIIIKGKTYSFNDIELKYDCFILIGKAIHLLNKFHLIKIVRFFKQNPAGLEIPLARFKDFHENVLSKLEDFITILYTYIELRDTEPAPQHEAALPLEKLIYLSDLRSYVIINPVMKYGNVEIPILTKRQIFSKDKDGNIVAVKRNDEAEIRFTALLLKQHPDFEEQLQYDPAYFYLHKQRLLDEDWFLDAFEQWREEGITVLGFNKLQGNKLNSHKAKVHIQVTSGLNWFNTAMDVSLERRKLL